MAKLNRSSALQFSNQSDGIKTKLNFEFRGPLLVDIIIITAIQYNIGVIFHEIES